MQLKFISRLAYNEPFQRKSCLTSVVINDFTCQNFLITLALWSLHAPMSFLYNFIMNWSDSHKHTYTHTYYLIISFIDAAKAYFRNKHDVNWN